MENTKNAEDMVRKIIASEEFKEKTEGYSVDKSASIDVYGEVNYYLDYKDKKLSEKARITLKKDADVDSCKLDIKGLSYENICHWEFDFEDNEIVYAKLVQNKVKISTSNDNPLEVSGNIIQEINKDEIKKMLK